MGQHVDSLHGDEAELFERYAARLRAVVAAQVNAPSAVVEDACMNAWMILLRRQPARETVWPWLKLVAIREGWRLAERERRELPSSAAEDVEVRSGVEAAYDLHADLEQLRGVLDPRKRRMLLLHAAGFTYDEISRITGDSPRTVERQMLRARARVRALR